MKALSSRDEAPDFALDILEKVKKVKSEEKAMYKMLLSAKEKAIIEMIRANEGSEAEEEEEEELLED